MLVSLNWLREYVEVPFSPAELAARLTAAGLSVDSFHATPTGDAVLDIEVTSNRPDCLGHVGVAREIAALTGSPLKLPAPAFAETAGPVGELIAGVAVEAPQLCPAYIARAVVGLRVGPSPSWLVDRLTAVGVASVSNIVDVTNYVMMECGQPLHAFDLDKLAGRRIVVRTARVGESLTAINGSELPMDPARFGPAAQAPHGQLPLVIADAARPAALAGVMGGRDSEISSATTRILLESADFDRVSVRRAARAFKDKKVESPSSFRFERGVDPEGLEWASRRAVELIIRVAGGAAAAGAISVRSSSPASSASADGVRLRYARIAAILGIAIAADEARRTLERLGFAVLSTDADSVTVRVPSWRRRDVSREIDLVEEVARVHGFADLPAADMPVMVSARSPLTVYQDRIAEALQAAGCHEVLTKSLVSAAQTDLAEPAGPSLSVDPDQTSFCHLRRSLLPSLLAVRARNQNVGVESARLYELARVFLPKVAATGTTAALPDEPIRLAVVADGGSEDDWRSFRGVLESAFAACGVADRFGLAEATAPAVGAAAPAGGDSGLDSAVSLSVLLDGHPIGRAGRLSRSAMKRFDLRRSVMVAELDVEPLCTAGQAAGRFRGLPIYPAVSRDLNVLVADSLLWQRLEAVVRAVGIAELESVAYLSTYTKGLPAGRKAVAFSMTFRSAVGTLTGEQANAFQAAVLARLSTELGAVLKT